MSFPLTGFRVIDLGDEATVLASRLLADLGADVVRIEDAAGDAVRKRGPFVGDIAGIERGEAHLLYNAGKRSLALALEREGAWDIVANLAARADVVIAPLEKRPLAATFFDETRLSAANSNVGIVDAVFRRHAPGEIATDLIGTAAGGLLVLNGYPEDPPNRPAGQLAYKQLSLAAALGAVSMILERALSGTGGRITVSMQEAVMWTTIQSANENYWHWHESRPTRRGLGNLGGQTIFEAKDGLSVSVYQHPPAWSYFVDWVAEALDEHRFAASEWDDQLYRYENQDQITAVTTTLCKTMSRDELVAEGQRRQILVVPVQTVTDIAKDPHLRERRFFQDVWFDQFSANLEMMRPPLVSSAYESHARPAPALGQHSREVLSELGGLDEARIEALVREGTVRVWTKGEEQ